MLRHVPLVSVDTNVIDLMVDATPTSIHVDCLEAMTSPPPYEDPDPKRRRQLLAAFWLLAVGPSWTSTLFTFSDHLYVEQLGARGVVMLRRFAAEMREGHPTEHRVPTTTTAPDIAAIVVLGIDRDDARHVSDAIGLDSRVLLTNDRRLRNKSNSVASRWRLQIRLPSEFLDECVRSGAPWPTDVAWPWELSV